MKGSAQRGDDEAVLRPSIVEGQSGVDQNKVMLLAANFGEAARAALAGSAKVDATNNAGYQPILIACNLTRFCQVALLPGFATRCHY